MKTNYRIIFILAFLAFVFVVDAQKPTTWFNSTDKGYLKDFLLSSVHKDSIPNYKKMGMTADDMNKWDDEVVGKIKGVTWNDATERRVVRIDWHGLGLCGTFRGGYYPYIEYFDISNNRISIFSVLEIKRLKAFKASDNLFTDLLTMRDLPNLEEADFSNNAISSLRISSCPRLKKLAISKLNTTYASIGRLDSLEFLNARGTNLQDFDFSLLKRLKVLHVTSSNKEVVIPDSLEYLYCNNSWITSLKLPTKPKLKVINLSKSKVSKIDLPIGYELDSLDISNARFLISDYPNVKAKYYKYDDLKTENLMTVELSDTVRLIDLSSEYMINGKVSTFSWKRNDKGEAPVLTTDGKGKFFFDPNYNKMSLLFTYSNPSFSESNRNILYNVPNPSISSYDKKELAAIKPLLDGTGFPNGLNTTMLANFETDPDVVVLVKDITWTDSFPRHAKRLDFDYLYTHSNIDITGFTELEHFDIKNTSDRAITLKNNPKLKVFRIKGLGSIYDLEVSNNPELLTFDGEYGGWFEKLDLSTNPKLKKVILSKGKLSKLTLPKVNLLDSLDVSSNKLKFSTLPLPTKGMKYYKYDNQEQPKEYIFVDMNKEIDFSSEYNIGGTISDFKWYLDDSIEVKPTSLGNGKFIPTGKLAGRTITCEMSNKLFPDLVFKYTIVVSGESMEIYDPRDVAALKEFLLESSSAGMNYSQFDISNGEMREAVFSLASLKKVKGITWNDNFPKRIISINWTKSKMGGSLDCTPFEELKMLSVSNNLLTSINITKNKKLIELYCADNIYLKEINLDSPIMNTVNFSRNSFEKIDLSKLPKLQFLYCDRASLKELNLEKNTALISISCEGNKFTKLDLTKNTLLNEVKCNDNNISELLLPNSPDFRWLNCLNNRLTFSALPTKTISQFFYDKQQDISLGTFSVGMVVDLSKESKIGNRETVYKWYRVKPYLGELVSIDVEDLGNGKFKLGPDLKNLNLVCKATNLVFPNLTLSYEMVVSDTSDVEENITENVDKVSILSSVVQGTNPFVIINKTSTVGKISVYNIQGRVVYNKLPLLDYSTDLYIEIPGVYIIEIMMSNNKIYKYKVIKQ